MSIVCSFSVVMLVMVYEKPKLPVVLPTHFSQEGHSRSVSPWGLFLAYEGIKGLRKALLIYHSFIAPDEQIFNLSSV